MARNYEGVMHMWKEEIKKAYKLNSYDETNAFAFALNELGVFNSIQDVLDFYSKPYKYQNMYEKLLKLVEEHFGEPASITEIVEVDELYDPAIKIIFEN